MSEESLALAVILLATAADAIRDATFWRWGWWPWHCVKWIAFYSPLAYIAWREEMPLWFVAVLAFFCLGLWEFVSRLFKRPWRK